MSIDPCAICLKPIILTDTVGELDVCQHRVHWVCLQRINPEKVCGVCSLAMRGITVEVADIEMGLLNEEEFTRTNLDMNFCWVVLLTTMCYFFYH